MAEHDDRPWMTPPAATVWDVAPGVGAEVTYKGRPATVVRVCSPGAIRGEVDLVTADGSGSDLHRSVAHDVTNGWGWPGEPPPAEPTPADRLRRAAAAGVFVPPIGSTVALVRARPKSIRGTAYVGLDARVDAVHDVVFEPTWDANLERRAGATKDSERRDADPNRHCKVLVALTLTAGAAELEGLEGVEPGQHFGLVSGPVAGGTGTTPFASHLAPSEGWVARFLGTVVPNAQFPYVDRPCERCGARRNNFDMVRLFAECAAMNLHPTSTTSPQFFARVCQACAEEIGRFACRPIPPRPEPSPVAVRATSTDPDDDLLTMDLDGEDGDVA